MLHAEVIFDKDEIGRIICNLSFNSAVSIPVDLLRQETKHLLICGQIGRWSRDWADTPTVINATKIR